MNDFANVKTCSGEEQRRETAKELLGNMWSILGEMNNEGAMISDAVYRGGKNVEKGQALTNEPCDMPPMITTMKSQIDAANLLLKEIVKIREALW